MDRLGIVRQIDQLHAEVITAFGRGSKTQVAIAALYDIAAAEADVDDTNKSDAEEFAAAHAGQQPR